MMMTHCLCAGIRVEIDDRVPCRVSDIYSTMPYYARSAFPPRDNRANSRRQFPRTCVRKSRFAAELPSKGGREPPTRASDNPNSETLRIFTRNESKNSRRGGGGNSGSKKKKEKKRREKDTGVKRANDRRARPRDDGHACDVILTSVDRWRAPHAPSDTQRKS